MSLIWLISNWDTVNIQWNQESIKNIHIQDYNIHRAIILFENFVLFSLFSQNICQTELDLWEVKLKVRVNYSIVAILLFAKAKSRDDTEMMFLILKPKPKYHCVIGDTPWNSDRLIDWMTDWLPACLPDWLTELPVNLLEVISPLVTRKFPKCDIFPPPKVKPHRSP